LEIVIAASEVEVLIRNAISCEHLEALDYKGGDHFQVLVVSADFQGKTLIDQHQMVHKALEPAMNSGALHAVQIKTETPESWKKKQANDDGLNVIQ
jgi:acid stress-induced BolA-like protein IbaG/YrbA